MCDCKNFLEYEQHLGKDLKRLYFEDKRYEPLRTRIQKQCSDKSDGLVFSIRKNEIHIYYRGGRLLKITDTAKGTALKLYTDPKYAGDENNPNNEIAKLNALDTSINENIAVWCDKLEVLKKYVADYYSLHGNKERFLQHKLELNNNDFNGEVIIIDNEYGVRRLAARLTHLDRSNPDTFCKFTETELEILSKHNPPHTEESIREMSDTALACLKLEYKLCKVDLVALFKSDNGKYKICLIELKKGYGATGGKAGIKDHIQDFKVFTESRKDDIVQSVKNLLKYKPKPEIGTIVNYPEGDIDLDEKHIYITILCYDLKTEGQRKSAEKKIKQALDGEDESVSAYFYWNLSMKETGNYVLRKEDLLKNKY